jgi:Flp pilus assembly pilin Flp
MHVLSQKVDEALSWCRVTWSDERAAIAAEYVLLLTLIAVAIIGTAALFGAALAVKYVEANACLNTLVC